jgi:hypothetical protein
MVFSWKLSLKKDAPVGVHIVLEGTMQCEEPLIAVGYCYSRKSILLFVLTEGAGSLVKGDPYKANDLQIKPFTILLL